MDSIDIQQILKARGINPSAQRLAIAEYVLQTEEHPTADVVLTTVKAVQPMVSRATVYNTLNLFVESGLLRQFCLEGSTVFDANTSDHHHFIDETTGTISDIPGDALTVSGIEDLRGFDVTDFHVVLKGTKKKR